MKTVIKTLLGGAAIALTAGIALAPSAQAACQQNGGNWNCDNAQQTANPPYYIPAPSWGFSPRDYQVPYYGATQGNPTGGQR